MPESLFNKVIGFYSATSLKVRIPIQVFSDEFCEILKTHSLQNNFCSTRKSFSNKIVKNFLRKEKMETACKKNKDTRETKT